MGLSNDLISQFVKSTKETKNNNGNGTLIQGVAKVKSDGTVSVKLGGSDIETPAVATTSVKDGERVLVTIKNHTAFITGTNVAANAGSVIQLTDEDGNVTNTIHLNSLVADNATIKERLTASEADIGDLKANTVKTEDLEAEYIKANTIESMYLKTSVADAKYATIENLDATHGKISNLIFGSATGDVIQTSFSNAVIAQLGDAQIKSAMIESISAGKIAAGDIITNNVRVMSEDGKLVISDETLQISDSSRVRVQIGKDESDDYSINIWDQNGNLMFSKGGITDAAIKEAIIRNDMVSDTANIHASKLDIDSLFEEINDSSNTIKSTKVYLDEEKQTLDVAFKSLTTEVTEQGETISSQGTAISTIQGQISSKVWQQDIDTATDEMSTKYSTLEQEVDSFKTTVSETYATVEDVDSISVGGRNLLLYSNEKKLTMHGGSTSTTEKNISVSEWNTTDAIHISGTGGTAPIFGTLGGTSNQMAASSNEYYAISVYIKNIHATNKVVITANHITADSVTVNPGEITRVEIAGKGNGWGYPQINFKTEVAGKEFDFIYWHPKIEKGNKPTDWSPAPEDIDAAFDSVDTRIASTESSITQLSNKITTNVTETTNLGKRMTTVEQTADDLSVKLDDLTIGGRNLYTKSSSFVSSDWVNTASWPIDGVDSTGNARRKCSAWGGLYQPIQVKAGETYTLSAMVLGDGASDVRFYATLYNADPTNGGVAITDSFSVSAKNLGLLSTIETKIFITFDVLKDGYLRARFENGVADSYMWISSMKLEKGNKPTDWSPAPEDVESDILEASKTATNYLNFSSGGLVIGDMTAATLGKNVLIDSDSVDIRNGDITLASFGADYLYLAKNSRNAKIDLCNGLATMYHESKYSYDTIFIIDTGNTTEIMGLINPLCVTSVDDLDQVSIQFANANGVMGGIGIVGSWLRRFGSNMFDTYTILDSGNYFDVMDDGWHYTGGYAENFTQYNNETHSQVRYRKVGGVVEVRGALKATTTIEGSDTKHTMFTLPEGYRPDCRIVQRCQGSGMHTWMLTVEESGAVTFSRYGVGTSYSDIGTTVWLPIQITFLVN